VLGGSASYISAVLRSFGANYRTVAKVGRDFRYAAQIAETIPGAIVEGESTTSFIDDYRGSERRETLQAAGARIRPEDVEGKYRIAIACGVAGEVLPETLLALRERAAIVIADAQGLVRVFGASGEVRVQPVAHGLFAEVLNAIVFLKASASELRCINIASSAVGDAQAFAGVLISTDGPRGATLQLPRQDSDEERTIFVPPFPAEEIDATGAGDCFLAGFAFGLARSLSLERSARLGNWCGARAVETVGVPTLDAAAALAAIGDP